MTYPEYLLPVSRYRIIDFDCTNISLRYLIRHTETKEIADKNGNLKSELVATDDKYNHLRDFSTNLLGVFQLTDVKWKWTRDTLCLEPWNPSTDGILPSEIDVSEDVMRGVFYLSIEKCHGTRFKTESEVDGESEVIAKVLHTPIRSNFWHCSIRWFCDGQDSEKWNKGRLRRMKSIIRSFIVETADLEEPIYQAVDPEAYT
ncbi:MAG: hypothetical protein LCH91_26540 [Bacteroidetes bacterium]|nr:hypothetical protein [Bacteroidota bacterium]